MRRKPVWIGLLTTIIALLTAIINHWGSSKQTSPNPQSTPSNSLQQNKTIINNINNVTISPSGHSRLPTNLAIKSKPILVQKKNVQNIKTPKKIILNCSVDQKVEVQHNFYVWCNGFFDGSKRWMREIGTNFLKKNLMFNQSHNDQLIYINNKPYKFSVIRTTKNPTAVILKIDHEKL